jgi:hypothetical protein
MQLRRGKDRGCKAGRLKSRGDRRGQGDRSTKEGVQPNALKGRISGLTMPGCGGKWEGMPETAKIPVDRVRQLRIQL